MFNVLKLLTQGMIVVPPTNEMWKWEVYWSQQAVDLLVKGCVSNVFHSFQVI